MRPIMPGVMIVEAMAQTSAVLVVQTLDMIDKDPLVYFMSIEEAKFRNPVTPATGSSCTSPSSAAGARSGSSPARPGSTTASPPRRPSPP